MHSTTNQYSHRTRRGGRAALVVVAAGALTLAACAGSSDGSPTTTSATTAPSATDPEPTEAPGTEAPDTTAAPETTATPDTTESPGTTATPQTTDGGTTATTEAGGEGGGLRIMLTNDDGWEAEGITAAYDALVAAGYDVTMVAPLENQSGTGGRVTLRGELTVTHPEEGKYVVEGTPADSAEYGLSAIFGDDNPPDLVISGSNKGQNVGAAVVHSGTVGAVVTSLNDGVPAIAISTETALFGGEGEPDYVGTAEYLVKVVQTLESQADGGALLPDGVGLNINYPMLTEGETLEDAVMVSTGTGLFDANYSGEPPAVGETTVAEIELGPDDENVENADTTLLEENHVVIAAIGFNYDLENDNGLVSGLVTTLNGG